jgi:hypothetical protein
MNTLRRVTTCGDGALAPVGARVRTPTAGGARLAQGPLAALALLAAAALGCGAESDAGPAGGDLSATSSGARDLAQTPAQIRRIQSFLDARYVNADVRHRFQSRFGENIDCIDFFAQPGVKALAAEGIHFDEIPKARVDERRPDPDQMDFGFAGDPDQDGHARICPEGSVPMKRITSAEILAAGGLDAFRAAESAPPLRLRAAIKAAQEAPLPATACDTQFGIDFDKYAHVQQTYNDNNQNILVTGTASLSIHVPTFPTISPGTIRGQMWMYSGYGVNNTALKCTCGGAGEAVCAQSVEAGWQVTGATPTLFTFATNDGYHTHCFGGATCTAPAPIWVQVSSRYMPGMALAPSTPFGTQSEISLSVSYLAFGGGSWSIMTGAEVIGGFAAKYFSGAMKTKAQTYQVGGEAIDPSNNWGVPMGSGAQPETGYGQAAYVHDVKACKDSTGTACLAPAAVSPVQTRPLNYRATSTPARKPGSSWGNWFYYGNIPSVFWGTNYGYQWAPAGRDWAVGDYKGECGTTTDTGQALLGMSAYTGGVHQAHAVECSTRGVPITPSFCYARRIPPNRQGTSDDWDPGYYKASCAINEFVLGVSQSSAGALTGVLCCPGGTVLHNGCTTQVLYNQNSSAYYSNGGADWDAGYDKAQCPAGQYVAGVSALSSTSQGVLYAPHAILCCPLG